MKRSNPPEPASNRLGLFASKRELAIVFGVSVQSIKVWLRFGAPGKGKDGLYNADAILAWRQGGDRARLHVRGKYRRPRVR